MRILIASIFLLLSSPAMAESEPTAAPEATAVSEAVTPGETEEGEAGPETETATAETTEADAPGTSDSRETSSDTTPPLDEAAAAGSSLPEPEAQEPTAFEKWDAFFGKTVVGPLAAVLFWDVWFWDNDSENPVSFPIVVLWLIFGAVFFTLRMSFINLRGFSHAIRVTAGQYDEADEEGEISHFQALSAALSATVGLGNIAGVAVAVGVGGPGAVFWMVVAGFLGMSSKFTECTLGQMYRITDSKGSVSGGPMHYLHKGLEDMGHGGLGKVLAIVFALMCIGGSLGGGNMFQANQSAQLVGDLVPLLGENPGIYGVLLAIAVGLVIVGGIKRIGMAAGAIVPAMCGIYVLAGAVVLMVNASEVPAAFGIIISSAFSTESVAGGAIGVLIQGFRRAAFSNEAGVGSAAIAHSAATTSEPVREGIVALLEPFIDTLIICTMTGLVIVTSGVYQDETLSGIGVTAAAFATVLPWFPIILSIAAVLFAFSTMISWSYYGERCWTHLFGAGSSIAYKALFLFCVFLGSVFSLGSVLDFSDLMILGMAFPNILGCLILSGRVRGALDEYMGKLERGEFDQAA